MIKVFRPSQLFKGQTLYKIKSVSKSINTATQTHIALPQVLIYSHETLNESLTDFLQKIIAACKLKQEQVSIIQQGDDKVEIELETTPGLHKHILLFGDVPLYLNQNIEFNKATVIGSTQILKTKPLSLIQSDKSEKEVFWNALKKTLGL